MAPVTTKRRRAEDEPRRPKKKVRKVKKQTDYHSSSDSDSDGPGGVPLTRRVAPAKPTGANAEPPAARPAKPAAAENVTDEAKPVIAATKATLAVAKPILKHTKVMPERRTPVAYERGEMDVGDDEEETESDVFVQTYMNTARNQEPGTETEEELAAEAEEIDETAKNTALNMAPEPESEDDDEAEVTGLPLADDSDADSDQADSFSEADSDLESSTSMSSSNLAREKKKRNDPSAFATSISKILDTKLTTSKRQDPVLSRSKSASEANRALANSRLETKARAQIRTEKKALSEKGRVRDVLGLESEGVETGAVVEGEKRLKKTAQRGVVKLFNAVRAAQVKAEGAARAARQEGVVGMDKRGERVSEMSKQGFLDLIGSGGKGTGVA